jgi:hypothetical protein
VAAAIKPHDDDVMIERDEEAASTCFMPRRFIAVSILNTSCAIEQRRRRVSDANIVEDVARSGFVSLARHFAPSCRILLIVISLNRFAG